MIPRTDYCRPNCLLCTLPSYQLACVKSVLNAAAYHYDGKRSDSDHVTPLLRKRLHCLATGDWTSSLYVSQCAMCIMVFRALSLSTILYRNILWKVYVLLARMLRYYQQMGNYTGLTSNKSNIVQNWSIFTARCTIVRSSVLQLHVVCLSVCL